MAPFSPVSSCTVATAKTSQAWRTPDNCSSASVTAATQARSSIALPATRLFSSSTISRRIEIGSPTVTRCSTFSAGSPTSTKSLSQGIVFLRSSSGRTWGGRVATMPGRSRCPWTITSSPNSTRRSVPPTRVMRKKPFSIPATINPISSMCAASINLGRGSEPAPCLRAIKLPSLPSRISSTKGCQVWRTNSRTGAS